MQKALEGLQERWRPVIEGLKQRGHRTAAGLLSEAEPLSWGTLPSGVQVLTLRFRYGVLLEKWNRENHGQHLSEVLRSVEGVDVRVIIELEETAKAVNWRDAIRQDEAQHGRRRAVRQEKAADVSTAVVCPQCGRGEGVLLVECRMGADLVTVGLDCAHCNVRFYLNVGERDARIRLWVGSSTENQTPQRDRRRAFGPKEKRELWLASGGRCSICRSKLGPDWHADHYDPWSNGGPTATANGIALCRDCNLAKGAKVLTVDEG